MTDSNFIIYAAPLQGYTEAPWRHYHANLFADGRPDGYFTPFLRIERGDIRKRDIRDITSTFNDDISLTPQIIFRDVEEMRRLTDAIIEAGHHRVDLNLGCPFPPQVKHGRGAALLLKPDLLEAIGREISERYSNLEFSAKMRIGVTDDSQWREALSILNDIPLTHLTVHPRIASQQYTGELHMKSFGELLKQSTHPVIFNGDILAPTDISDLKRTYPAIAGVMIGRGLLSRPSLIEEWRTGKSLSEAERLSRLKALHEKIFEVYRSTLCGDTQILMKIRPFWDYSEALIGRRSMKAIRKASSLRAYITAVSDIANV